jgi:hypothetical protein
VEEIKGKRSYQTNFQTENSRRKSFVDRNRFETVAKDSLKRRK